MRSSVRCARLFLARSADYPIALIRPLTTYSLASATRKPVSYSTTTKLAFRQSARTFTMSSSANQTQPDKASTSASAERPVAATASSSTTAKTEPELPPLSPQEFRAYNRLAETMDYFHDHFRKSWKLLYTAASTGKRPGGMTLKQFIDEGLSLVRYLETHHGIEESYFFPLLAKKMPEFRSGKGNGAAELLQQHRQIHAGMDVFEEYLRKCRSGETELELSVMKEKMDLWGDVLLKHLDQEVETLGAENMRRYWTIAEIRAMPI